MKLIKKLFKAVDNLISNKIIKWIIIPIALLFLWLSLSLVYSSYKSFTVLHYNHNRDENNNFPIGKILKNQRIIGEFTARENNLGIVSVRLGILIHNLENADRLLFHIREKGRDNWYYETVYDSGFFNRLDYSPFGFPTIADSKGKIYEFEIVSLNGNAYSAIEIEDKNPIYISKYKLSKDEIFKDQQSLINFAIKKVLILFSNYEDLLSSSIFLFPFVFYFMRIIIVRKIDGNNISHQLKPKKQIIKIVFTKELFAILVLTLIFADLFLVENLIMGFLLGLFGFWIIAVYLNKFKIYMTIILTFVIISISIVSTYFDWVISINKASTYAYFLIIFIVVQGLLEDRKNNNRNK